MKDRLNYFRRIFKVYFSKETSYLKFWHEEPAVSEELVKYRLGPYYMTFADKAAYVGPKDSDGVILFDYFFDIGRQYNPLAVAQYGLGYWNLYLKDRNKKNWSVVETQAKWLVKNLEENEAGLHVWKHKFRWHYKQYLEPGWFSAHSQGTGISLLARVYLETADDTYLKAAKKAFISLKTEIKNGGVKFVDSNHNVWLEEYLVHPPTHILNGFLWALWGVYDYWLLTKDESAKLLWDDCTLTLKKNLPKYDLGFWSKYDLSKQALSMIASHFYHKLHIVQLRATHILSGEKEFDLRAKKWEKYYHNFRYRLASLLYKAVFKLIYF